MRCSMQMTGLVAGVIAGLGLLSACGGSEPAPPAPTPAATSTASPSTASQPAPEAAAPKGDPAPEALSDFRCAAGDGEGSAWTAAGVLSNRGTAAATYQVSVYVGPLDGESREVRTIRVGRIDPGGSDRFDLENIPAGGDACHVQVLRLAG